MSANENGRRSLLIPILTTVLATMLAVGLPAFVIALRSPSNAEVQAMIDRTVAPLKTEIVALEAKAAEVDRRFDAPQDARLDLLGERLAALEERIRALVNP